MGSKMRTISSPDTTFYRLVVVTIGLSLTVFAVLRSPDVPDGQTDRQTDGRTDGIGLAIGGTTH